MSASGSGKKKGKVEKRLSEWANTNKQLMIAGHTHRPSFAENREDFYFNDGSCVAAGAITGIELVDGRIRLVKWSMKTKNDNYVYIGREVLREEKLEIWDKGNKIK